MTHADPDRPEPQKDEPCLHCGGSHPALTTFKLELDLNAFTVLIMSHIARNLAAISTVVFIDKARELIESGTTDEGEIALFADMLVQHGVVMQQEMVTQIAAGMGALEIELELRKH